MFQDYTREVVETSEGWYWKLYFKGERINGGLQPTYRLATTVAISYMNMDDSKRWMEKHGRLWRA